MSLERVQKILAQAGIASRRKAEELIRDGLVTINGKVAQLGDKASWGQDAIKVSGKLLTSPQNKIYLAFHKPKAVLSTLSDPEGRPTLASYLDKIKERVFPVGRLDFNSEGLILLTNDGNIAEQLQKKENLPRVYTVKVKGHPDAEMMARLERGIRLGEAKKRFFKPHSVRIKEVLANKAFIEVVILEAGAFDIKSYFEQKGFLVERVIRTSIGQLTLKGLEAGHYRHLKLSQLQAMIEQPELAMIQINKDSLEKPKGLQSKITPRGEFREGKKSRITPRSAVQANKAPSNRGNRDSDQGKGRGKIRKSGLTGFSKTKRSDSQRTPLPRRRPKAKRTV